MENRIGAAIRAKRKVFGYSQEQLAEKVGKTPSFIGQIERGKAQPSVETLTLLTQTLAIDANEYFYDAKENNRDLQELSKLFMQLTPKMRRLSLGIFNQIYKLGK